MGWVQYRLGNQEEALKWLQKAIVAMPDPEVAAHLGEVLWSLGRQEEARKVWNDSAKEHKENEVLRKTMERLMR
jgi:predicted negative regulator of RcsB-dependent stress response